VPPTVGTRNVLALLWLQTLSPLDPITSVRHLGSSPTSTTTVSTSSSERLPTYTMTPSHPLQSTRAMTSSSLDVSFAALDVCATPSSPATGFMHLPAELRIQVYKYIIDATTTTSFLLVRSPLRHSRLDQTSRLRTSPSPPSYHARSRGLPRSAHVL
jgi:hypothetical protein